MIASKKPNLNHDILLFQVRKFSTSQNFLIHLTIFIYIGIETLPQEVVDDKGFIAVPDSIEVDIEVIIAEEEQAQPRGEGVHRNNEQDTNYPALLSRVSVVSEKNQIDRYI